MKFRKKSVVVEAVQVPIMDATDWSKLIYDFFEKHGFKNANTTSDGGFDIKTLEGTMHADGGDWIIRGIKGEFYPCKPDIFETTYEPAE